MESEKSKVSAKCERYQSYSALRVAFCSRHFAASSSPQDVVHREPAAPTFDPSRGQQRTAILAFKLAELDLLTLLDGRPPLLLLDDVFSELDPDRRSWLGRAVRSAGQVILSSAEPGAPEAARADRVIEVTRGEVSVRG